MNQRRSMEQLHGGAQGNEFLLRCAKHIADEQAEGGPDPFASGREDVLQCRAQIWVMILSSLISNPLFYEFKLILHRCEKGDRAQRQPPQPNERAAFLEVTSATCSRVVM